MEDEEHNKVQQQQTTCAFFVKRKNRFCKMHVGKGKKYCGEHLLAAGEESDRKRVPCPLDPNHTVYEDQLSKHLKRCNKTKKTQVIYYEANINSGIANYSPCPKEKILLSSVPKEDLENFVEKVNKLYTEHCLDIEEGVLVDEVFKYELTSTEGGPGVLKHLYQQASLIGHLREQGLLKPNTVFVEFGAGRGMLSHWLQKALPECTNVDFLLVDRASNRYKFDSYHKGEKQGPSFQRLNLDIEHLNLGKVPCISEQSRKIVSASKHLCGAATDLSLRCLFESTAAPDGKVSSEEVESETSSAEERKVKRQKISTESRSSHVGGVVFALCCHHRCNWPHYVGREFMTELGLGPDEFHLLCCLSSWATCGMGLKRSKGETSQNHCEEGHQNSSRDTEKCTNDSNTCQENSSASPKSAKGIALSTAEQEEFGRRCKRLIDTGRLAYLRSRGFKAVLTKYIDSTVSLENIALIATRTPGD